MGNATFCLVVIVVALLSASLLSCSTYTDALGIERETGPEATPTVKPWSGTPATPWTAATPRPQVVRRAVPTPTSAVKIHWELAEAHVEAGGPGTAPVTGETSLSRRIKTLLTTTARACRESETAVATLVLAGHLTILVHGLDYTLLEFMELFSYAAGSTPGTCEDAALTVLEVMERVSGY